MVWHWSHAENLSMFSIIIIPFWNKDKISWTLLPAPTGQSGCVMQVKEAICCLHLPLLFLFRESVKHPYCSLFRHILRIKSWGLTLKDDWSCQKKDWSKRIFSPNDPHASVSAFLLLHHYLQKNNIKEYYRYPKECFMSDSYLSEW